MFEPKKELGQNFLTDKRLIENLVNLLDLKSNDVVVEIGSGLGIITEELAKRIISENILVTTVEIDSRFVEKLNAEFKDYLNVQVINADILEWLPKFEPPVDKAFKIIGSLPYYITSPIIHSIVKMGKRPDVSVLVVQKEVAQRICDKAPDATYLSVFVQTFFDVEYKGSIDKSKFSPVPQVDGEIIRLMKKSEVGISSEQMRRYEGFLHKGFASPRKMLNKVFTKEELSKVNVDGNLRPQNLDADKWVEVFKVLN